MCVGPEHRCSRASARRVRAAAQEPICHCKKKVVHVDPDPHAFNYKADVARDTHESVGERHCVGRRLGDDAPRARTGERRELCTDPMAAAEVGERTP